MAKWNQRRRQSGKAVKTYSTETQNLIRHRLREYATRHGLARFDLAYDVSSWEPLSDWFPAAREWQKGDKAEWDDKRGVEVEGVPSGKRDQGFPITQRFFDLWFGGKSKAGKDPERPKFDAIVHYMIDTGIILSEEIAPDDRGFALANALQTYIGEHDRSDVADWEGSFEYQKRDGGRCALYKLRVERLAHGPLFLLLGYSSAKVGTGASSEAVFEKMAKAPILKESRRSGWSVRLGDRWQMGLLRPLHSSEPMPADSWVFGKGEIKTPKNLSFSWCSDAYFRKILDSYNTNLPIFTENLQVNTEIDYSLGRRGDQTENIIRRIFGMKDFEDAAEGQELSELDKKFLKAALWAEDGEDFAELEQLLAAGADINAIDPDTGATALITAAHWGAEEVADFLLKQPGIDVLIKDRKYGWRAAEMAIKCTGKIELADRLSDAEIEEERRRVLLPPQRSPS